MRRHGAFVCLLAVAALLGGCSGAKQLDTAADARSFIDDIADGKNVADDWELGPSASPLARASWQSRSSLETVAGHLRKAPEWACDVVDVVSKANDLGLMTVTDAQRAQIILDAERSGASAEDVESMLSALTFLTETQALELSDSLCTAAGL